MRRIGVLAGSVVALGVGAVLAAAFGLALHAAGWIAPRLTVGVGLLPLLGWVYGWRRQRARDLAAAVDDLEIRATRGRLSVATSRTWGARSDASSRAWGTRSAALSRTMGASSAALS